MSVRYFAAYGADLNKKQMEERCPGARVAGTSVIEGYCLLFKGGLPNSYLTIKRKKGGSVPVGVWEVTEAQEGILDRYEKCPALYRKEEFRLPVTDGQTGEVRQLDVFAYIMVNNRKACLPLQKYYLACLEGYRDFGFDEKPLYEAYEYTRELVFAGS
jgi:hypothetical protein